MKKYFALLIFLSAGDTYAQVKIGTNPTQVIPGVKLQVDGDNTTVTLPKFLITGTGLIGINTAIPGTYLDVNGAITNRETAVAVAANAATVPANTSQVQLTGTATGTVTVTAPAAPNAGQRLIIYNNTTGGFNASLNSILIPVGSAMEFIYSNSGWRATNGGATADKYYDWLKSGNAFPTATSDNTTDLYHAGGRVAIGTTNTSLAGLRVVGADEVSNEVHFDSYSGTINQYPAIRMHKARGTEAAPANLQSGDYIAGLAFVPQFNGNANTYTNNTGLTAVYEGNGTTNATSLRFYTSSDMPLSGERMRIDQNGNVGIGTNAPAQRLNVFGSSILSAGSVNPANMSNSWNDVAASTGTSEAVVLRLVNTSATATNNTAILGFNAYNGGGATWGIGSVQNDATSSNSDFNIFYSSGGGYSRRFTVKPSGNVGINTTAPDQTLTVNGNASKSAGGISWAIFSDRRVKKDIRPFTDGLEQVLKIKPVFFKYNGLGGITPSEKDEVGIIAQDMQKVAPYTISVTKNKLKESDVAGEALLQFDRGDAIIYMLVNAVKELQAQILALKGEVQQLKGGAPKK